MARTTKTVISHHRSLELAESHARRLERENPGARVEITSRRNADGEESSRGRTFFFAVTLGELEIDSLEDFQEIYDETDSEDFIDEEYDGSADYAETT